MTLEILRSNPALEPMLQREEKRSQRLAYDAAHPYVPATTLIMHFSTAELTFMNDMFVHVHMSPEPCSFTRDCREPFVIQPPVQLHLGQNLKGPCTLCEACTAHVHETGIFSTSSYSLNTSNKSVSHQWKGRSYEVLRSSQLEGHS